MAKERKRRIARATVREEGNHGGDGTDARKAWEICHDQFFAALPATFARLLKGYQNVLADLPTDEVQSYADGQLACRSALLHLHELCRLGERLAARQGAAVDALGEEELRQLIERAREAVAAPGIDGVATTAAPSQSQTAPVSLTGSGERK